MENRLAALETAMEKEEDGITRESVNLKKRKSMDIFGDTEER